MREKKFGYARSENDRALLGGAFSRACPYVAVFLLFLAAVHASSGVASAGAACGDVDCSGTVLSKDALIVLKTAVGIDAGAQCECSQATTTTTLSTSCPAVDVSGFTAKLAASRCVAYSPSGNWNPNTGQYLSPESVSGDLALLRETGFDCVVSYGADHVLADVPCLAREAGFTLVVMGIWDPASEIERASAVATAGCADAYSVGNEGLTIPYCCGAAYSWDDLSAAIASLRAETCRPVTTSEPGGAYFDGVAGYSAAEMRGVGDWIFANAHPYFAGKKDAAAAVAWTVERYQTLVAGAPGRFVMFKEVGLPSEGDAGLNEANQRTYYEALLQTASRFVVFEAFDQAWKQNLPVEPHWGIFKSDRAPKAVSQVFAGGG